MRESNNNISKSVKIIKENNKSYKNLIIIILIIIILALISGIVYFTFFNKHKEELNDNNIQEQEKSNEEEIVNNGNYELTVYRYKNGGELTKETKKDRDLEEAFIIKTNNSDAKVLAVNNKFLVLYNDGGLYIYNSKTKKSEKVSLENTYKEYEIYTNEDNDSIIGIGYINNNKYGYYNVVKKIKLYTDKYSMDELWHATQINNHYLSIHSGDMLYLLSSDSEIARLSYKDTDNVYDYRSFGKNGKYIFALSIVIEDDDFRRFYSNNFKLFYEAPDDGGIWNVVYNNNYLYLVDDNVLKKYNTNGDLISSNTNYVQIKGLLDDYIVYVKNDNLILENIEDSSESKVLTKWNDKWSAVTYGSGYYSREDLDSMDEKDKKEGLYIVVEYNSDKKDSKGNYGMEYCYTSLKQIIEYPIKEMIGGRAKPVLYLYPLKETNVKVKFSNPELLTTTYPKYNDSWNVTVKPNGDMYDKDGKYYYALYWDEKRYNEVDFKEGYYVDGKDAISFLEDKLTLIGLNDKERNEFIMYWLPVMESNEKNLVYFELTEEREVGNKLIIDPKPDSLLRVSIHIKKVNKKIDIKEQKLEKFNRLGFVAVEWGGMIY